MFGFRALYVSALVTLAVATIALPAQAEVVYPAGLRVGLEPPGDMKLMARAPGFEDVESKARIAVLDLPAGAYEDLERSAFEKNQAGLEDVKRESFPFASGIGFLVSGHAKENGVTVYKWFLLAKSVAGPVLDLTTLISVEVPESARAIYTDAVVRKALTSVSFRAAPIQEQLGLLPFTLGELAGFRVMQVLAAGGVIITDGPTDNLTQQPYMIISVGAGAPQEPTDRGRFARDMLASAPLRELKVTLGEAMRINNGPGYEIRAQAKGLDGTPVTLVQWLRFGGSGFLRIVGVSRADAWDTYFTRFRAVRDGIETR